MDIQKIEDLYGLSNVDLSRYERSEAGSIPIKPYFTISKFSNTDYYESVMDNMIDAAKTYISESKKNVKKMYVAYKFDDDDTLRTMNFIRFIFNIIMWRPYFKFGIKLTEKDIFAPEVFHNKKYNDYFNKFSEKYCDMFTMGEFSEQLFWVQVYMNRFVTHIGAIFGDSISIYDMVAMAKKNKEIDAIINTKVDLDNFNVREVEEFLISQTERLFQILLSETDKNNPLKPFIRAGVGVNRHQTQESYVHLGFKPGLDGNTIPLTTNSNLMTEGLNTPEAIFVDSKGGHKAAILQMGVDKAGYFGRHTTFTTSDTTLHEDPTHSCNTVNLYKTRIASARELESFAGRFMKVDDKRYRIITRDDTKLIGTDVELRSPTTCASLDGKICKTCYGILYNINYGMHVGLYAAIDANESKTQMGLSARHALDTTSARIDMIDDNRFLINRNGWLFSLSELIDKSKYELVFIPSDISMVKEENYDQYDNYFTHHLVFRNKTSREEFKVYEASDCNLYLSHQLFKLLNRRNFFILKDEEEVTIPLEELSCNDPFVFLKISNKELAAPIKKLTKFIQRGKKPLKGVTNYSDFIYTVNSLFRTGGVEMPSVHIEILIRNLIRNKQDDLLIPDWSIPQTPDMYRMTSLNDAILCSSSVINSILFEQVKRQFKNPNTYRKTATSMHSLLFVNE